MMNAPRQPALTTQVTAGPGGAMTVEAGVVTGELTVTTTDERVFQVRYSRPDRTADGLLPRSRSLDTISISLYYLFF